jgi:hypothetical protein
LRTCLVSGGLVGVITSVIDVIDSTPTFFG